MKKSLAAVYPIYIFCALPCEAKPLIAYFGLKKIATPCLFDIYQGSAMTLTVTGAGKSNMAAGIAYTLASQRHQPLPVMLNIGIAGHREAELGSLFAAEKITDYDAAKSFYPQMAPHGICPTLAVQTVSRPHQNYAVDVLYDMEASAFYEIATRFTCSELILPLKIVSDNAQSSLTNINAKLVTVWVRQHLETVNKLLELLTKRAQHFNYATTDYFEQVTKSHHFTVSEKIQLKGLISRWEILSKHSPLPVMPTEFRSTRAFLDDLNARINELPVFL